MLRAVFVRTLKPGVSYEQFLAAWAPEGGGGAYPASVSVSRSATDDRQVITILELDISVGQFSSVAGSLTRSDALDRLTEVVESTQLEGLYEQVFDTSDVSPRGGGGECGVVSG
jgi:hypothetical protein